MTEWLIALAGFCAGVIASAVLVLAALNPFLKRMLSEVERLNRMAESLAFEADEHLRSAMERFRKADHQ